METQTGITKRTSCGASDAEEGFALAVVLILMLLGAIAVSASLQTTANASRTELANKQRSERYYKAETALSKATAWLRENSDSIVSVFQRENFYTAFERSESEVGTNDTAYQFPTRIKLAGTGNSAILTNSSALASSAFPVSTTSGGTQFDAASSFAAVDFGGQFVRITLVDAIAKDHSKDYGGLPAATPKTDFYPIFRIDAMTGVERGAQVYGYFTGKLAGGGAYGFYGHDYVDARQDCDSYDSSTGSYSAAQAHAECPVTSAGSVCVQNNATIYGSVTTTGSVSSGGSCDGSICTDTHCGQHGTPCQGASCDVPSMPTYLPWTSYCPTGSGHGDVNVGANITTALTAGSTAGTHCWGSVSVANKGTLQLTSTAHPYYIQSLDLGDTLNIQPDDPSGSVTLYVLDIVGGKVNGKQVINANAKASQFHLIYLGTSELKLNGNASMQMMVTSPNAGVDIQGNADFYGGVVAKYLTMTGSASLHFDENGSSNEATDFTLIPREVTQYYR